MTRANKTARTSTKAPKAAKQKRLTVPEAAREVLHTYRETFARYDRGETPIDTNDCLSI